MGDASPVVFVVDDDASVRKAIESLLRSVRIAVRSFGSAREFLASPPTDGPACLVLDVHLPGLSGLDLQRELAARGSSLPIVFITGHGDIPMSVRAMKAGAVEFLPKPFHDQDLLDAIQSGVDKDRAARQASAAQEDLRARLDSLTPRERQVLELVVAGMLNKQIAYDLNISEVTVKIHRGRAMHKLQADSLAELVRMAEKLGVRPKSS